MFKFFLSIFFGINYLFLSLNTVYAEPSPTLEQNGPAGNRGVWISCFSEKRVLYSKEAVLELIEFCKKTNINEIYLQLYRANQAYYDSKITNRVKYDDIIKSAGIDTIEFLLQEGEKNDIKVFAWLNVLSLSENKNANIITKYGNSVLTKDQYQRVSRRGEGNNESDKYYLRDKQIFLEPGDPKVVEYALSIVNEIIKRYPEIDGVHLDYVRYPYTVPYIPNSKFEKFGLVYGYGELNIARFKEKTGFDPLPLRNEKDNCLLWDNWKRDQVTFLVEEISKQIKKSSPDLLVSCAVIPDPGQAYSVAFQDWPFWLEEGIVDYVVIMDYTRDSRLAKETAQSALSHRGKGKVYVGIGTFLMENEPDLFLEQYKSIYDLRPDGVVFFSYDSVSKEEIMGKINLQ